MPRPTSFGAQCEHGRLARKCERCDDADEIASLRDCAKQYEQWLAQDHATIADLRDRLRVMAPWVCRGCGCAAEEANDYDEVMGYCPDCDSAAGLLSDCEEDAAACVSVGMRALCGRRILEGC